MKAKALLKEILNTDYTLQYKEKLIKEFAQTACKEQRKADNEYMKGISETHKELYGDIILNTPLINFK